MAGVLLSLLAAALLHPAPAPLPPGAHPHEVPALGLRQDGYTVASSPYSDLISGAVAGCYRRLVKDPSCCVDKHYSPGVQRRVVDRPGTSWVCDGGCYDERRGLRGRDLLWVPDGATCSSPRILWVHGGSWWYGSPETLGYAQLGSKLAALTGAVVLVPDYPLIPSGNFSVILSSVVDAMGWLAENGPSRCGPRIKAPLFVGGDSAGGGTALSFVLKLKQEPQLLPEGRSLAGALLWSPWTNLMCNTPDYYHHAFAEIVHPAGPSNRTVYVGDIIFQGRPMQNLNWFTANAEGYVGSDHSLLRNPVASPFFAGEELLGGGGVPPLYFAVGGSESILGDSVVVAQKASYYGVSVQLDVYPGMWHVFPMYSEGCGLGDELWQASHAWRQTAAFARWAASRQQPALAEAVAGPVPEVAATTDLGAAWVPRPPFTVFNYELEAAHRTDSSPGGSSQPVAQADEVLGFLAVVRHRRQWTAQACSGSVAFVLGAVSTLALQLAARGGCRRSKDPPGGTLSPLLA